MLFEIIFAAFFAGLITFFISGVLRRTAPGPLSGWLFIFATGFLVIWAGGRWIQPFGPSMWGYYFWPGAFLAIFIALILAAALPTAMIREKEKTEDVRNPTPTVRTIIGLDMLFWLLMLFLLMAVFTSYQA